MNDKKMNRVFDSIHAEEHLKQNTLRAIRAKAESQVSQEGQQTKPTWMRRLVVLAASLALLFAAGVFAYRLLYDTEAAYIDLDVNPSIELAVNRFGRVIDAAAYNEDGKEILELAEVQGLPYREAVEVLISEIAQKGYFDGTENLVSMTVQTDASARETEMLTALQQTIDQTLAANRCAAEVSLFAVTGQVRRQAHGHGLSPAKYLAILELQEVDPTATFEGCHGQSIREINNRTEACRQNGGAGNHGNGGAEPDGNHNGTGNQYGQQDGSGIHHDDGHD